MSKIDDDDGINQLFNKAANHYDIKYDERDWQKMEKMLDAEDTKTAAVRSSGWKVAAIGFGLLLLLSTIYLYVRISYPSVPSSEGKHVEKTASDEDLKKINTENNSTKPDNESSQLVEVETAPETDLKVVVPSANEHREKATGSDLQINNTANQNKSSYRKSTKVVKQDEPTILRRDATLPAGNDAETRKSNVKTKAPEDKTLVRDDKIRVAQTERKNDTDLPRVLNTETDNKKIDAVERSDYNFAKANNASVLEPASDDSVQFAKTTIPVLKNDSVKNNEEVIVEESSGSIIQRENKVLHQKDTLGNASLSYGDVSSALIVDSVKVIKNVDAKSVEEDSIHHTVKEKEDRIFNYSRWSVSLALAPDFSSSEIFKQTGSGSAFGVTIQYDLARRWTLQTGALLTKKKYWNTGDEYGGVRKGYWIARTNGIIPERIDGSCTVLEIPLAVRYTVFGNAKNRIQASGGVSSYIMLHETYAFRFENPNPYADESWESSETQKYMLGIGSVSIAYERMIHPKLAIGVEPYAKIPFTKVGWAKLPLYSMGAYFTMRYRILRQTK